MKQDRNSGFTFIELLAVLSVMSIFTVVSITMMTNVVDEARYVKTAREMEVIRSAIIGETQELETGYRKHYGYLGDVGAMPNSLSDLSTKPSALPGWALNATYGIGTGWKGPYIQSTLDEDILKDAWGNSYVYAKTGSTWTLTSYGADGVAGGTNYNQDIVLNMPIATQQGQILGYVVQQQGDVIGADQVPFSNNATITIYYPDGSGGIGTATTTISAANSGYYQFTGKTLGFAAVKVFIPDSASPTTTLGPSIVEIDKAATAAIPIASSSSGIYGTSSACTTAQSFTWSYISSAANTIQFAVSWGAAYTWNNNFYYDNTITSGAMLSYFTTSLVGGAQNLQWKASAASSTLRQPTGTDGAMYTGSSYFVTPQVIMGAGTHNFSVFYQAPYAGGTNYFRIGCKYFNPAAP